MCRKVRAMRRTLHAKKCARRCGLCVFNDKTIPPPQQLTGDQRTGKEIQCLDPTMTLEFETKNPLRSNCES